MVACVERLLEIDFKANLSLASSLFILPSRFSLLFPYKLNLLPQLFYIYYQELSSIFQLGHTIKISCYAHISIYYPYLILFFFVFFSIFHFSIDLFLIYINIICVSNRSLFIILEEHHSSESIMWLLKWVQSFS